MSSFFHTLRVVCLLYVTPCSWQDLMGLLLRVVTYQWVFTLLFTMISHLCVLDDFRISVIFRNWIREDSWRGEHDVSVTPAVMDVSSPNYGLLDINMMGTEISLIMFLRWRSFTSQEFINFLWSSMRLYPRFKMLSHLYVLRWHLGPASNDVVESMARDNNRDLTPLAWQTNLHLTGLLLRLVAYQRASLTFTLWSCFKCCSDSQWHVIMSEFWHLWCLLVRDKRVWRLLWTFRCFQSALIG